MATICSTLSGKVALKHPNLNILVRCDGAVFASRPYRWSFGSKYKGGYMYICVCNNRYRVHRLIAEAFIENPCNKPTVDHINRVRNDNRVENLRWATIEEQCDNKVDTLFPKYGVRRTKEPLLYSRIIGSMKRNKHYDLGEIFHRCSDGKRRWHKPGECPILLCKRTVNIIGYLHAGIYTVHRRKIAA